MSKSRFTISRYKSQTHIALAALACIGIARPVLAACNLIPGRELTYDAAIGATNRPFAAPNEPIEFRIRPCDSGSTAPTGFVDPASSYVVTVIFHGNVNDHAVVLSTNCAFFDTPTENACETQLRGTGTAICIAVSSPQDLDVVNRNGDLRLSLRFPDTDNQLDLVNDDRTLAGPTAMVITKVGDPLPCQVSTQACRTQTALVACVDNFYANDGTCQTRVPLTTFGSFTALPVPNDYGHCFGTVPPCDPQSPDEFRVTTDAAGNVLAPIDWRAILVQQNLVPVPRLLRATLGPSGVSLVIPGRSFLTSHTPEGGLLPPIFEPQFDIGAASGVATLFGSADAPYTVLRMARRSESFRECSGGANDGLPCNEAEDCPGACVGPPNAGERCTEDADCSPGTCGTPGTCGPTVCNAASTNPGTPCNSDRNCPNGACGPELFDVAGAAASGIGPVLITRFGTAGICQSDTADTCSLFDPCGGTGPCVEYALEAQNPVPLEGLDQSASVSAFSVDEGVDGVPRNGDGLADDTVVTLQDRDTGARRALGAPAGCAGLSGTPEGRAIVRVRQLPFSFPAVATEGSVVAFLESEYDNALCDENNDDDHDDAILRVFRNEAAGAGEATGGLSPAVAAEADLKINHRSLAVSNGRVFFRTSEDAGAPHATTRVSVTNAGGQADGYSTWPTMSADGRYVAYQTQATNLTAGTDDNNVCNVDGGQGGGTSNCLDVYMRDRLTSTTKRISLGPSGQQANEFSFRPAISADGSVVYFETFNSNWFPPFNYDQRIVSRDHIANTTVEHAIGFTVSLAVDKPLFAFFHFIGLLPTDTNFPFYDVYLRNTQTNTTELVSVDANGTMAANGNSSAPSISPSGRYVAFFSEASNLVNPPTVTQYLYLRDLMTGTTRNIARNGVPGGWSGDSRYLAFYSGYPGLIPADTNGSVIDVFVYDTETGLIDLASVDSTGAVSDGDSTSPRLSSDGRYVSFVSIATDLVADDNNGILQDVFVHDRLTQTTVRVSVGTDEVDGDGDSSLGAPVALSTDGREVAFASLATNLIGAGNDTNGVSDVFVRQADPAFLLANDSSGDGDLNDTVLELLDAATDTRTALCPAGETKVIGGAAAFLRPEGAGAAPDLETPGAGIAGCPTGATVSGGISLNGDTDPVDDVVHFWPGSGSVQNLARAASSLAIGGICNGGSSSGSACNTNQDCDDGLCTATWIAASVSEAGQNQTDFNDDQDEIDDVVQVYSVATSSWNNIGQAADDVETIGNLVVFRTPEDGANLNGDNDTNDRVLQIYDNLAGRLTNLHRAAEDFVVARGTDSCTQGPVVALRVPEADQGNQTLNSDSDADDDVLYIWSKGTGLVATGQTIRPCGLEACDPRIPYRIIGSRVKFLTFECDQGGPVTAGCPSGGTDLNGDGDAHDLILQQFDACTRELELIGEVDDDAGSAGDPLSPPDQGGGDVFVTTAGRCYQGATLLLVPGSCISAADCPDGATCEEERIVATDAVIPRHDAVLLPRQSLTVKLSSGSASATAVLKVKLRNGDVSGSPSTLRLTAADGTCPPGTVAGLPDLDSRTDGNQDSIAVKPRKQAKAVVRLMISAAAFTTHNADAPARCTLFLEANVAEQGNIDPTPRNNLLAIDLNINDLNDTPSVSMHESVLAGAKAVKLKIGNDPTASKTIKVQVTNADGGEADHDISVTADDGDCPAGTITAISPTTATVGAGLSAKVEVTVTVAGNAFMSPSKYAPARCTAMLSATTAEIGNVEPDPSNNSTPLLIDVVDAGDF